MKIILYPMDFFGINLMRGRKNQTLMLQESYYIEKISKMFGMEDCAIQHAHGTET